LLEKCIEQSQPIIHAYSYEMKLASDNSKLESFVPLNLRHPGYVVKSLKDIRQQAYKKEIDLSVAVTALRFALLQITANNEKHKKDLQEKSDTIAREQKSKQEIQKKCLAQMAYIKELQATVDELKKGDKDKNEIINLRNENKNLKNNFNTELEKSKNLQKQLDEKDAEIKKIAEESGRAIASARGFSSAKEEFEGLTTVKGKPAHERSENENMLLYCWKFADEYLKFCDDAKNGLFPFETSRYLFYLLTNNFY
jgi:hypothetical protein